jgi:hypothetical protein
VRAVLWQTAGGAHRVTRPTIQLNSEIDFENHSRTGSVEIQRLLRLVKDDTAALRSKLLITEY